MGTKFCVATEEDIMNGRVTDKYFNWTKKILEDNGRDPYVVMEAWTKKFPRDDYKFGILNGVQDTITLLDEIARRYGSELTVYSMDEGEVFFPNTPVMQIEGRYRDFLEYETAILGLLSEPSGISTAAARVRLAADDKYLASFGTRRRHPLLAPMIERAIYIAGFDGVSNIRGAEKMGKEATGTMPHALVLVSDSSKDAFEAFNETLPDRVKRIMLTDTTGAIKEESLDALEVLGDDLYGIRVDSQDRRKVGEEMRWEFDMRKRDDIKLFVSGGLDEYKVADLKDVYDGFGVGTRIASSPVMDFALKIVEVDGKPRAKMGNPSGAKEVYRSDFDYIVLPRGVTAPEGYEPLLKPRIVDGKRVYDFESVDEIRERVLRNLRDMPEYMKVL